MAVLHDTLCWAPHRLGNIGNKNLAKVNSKLDISGRFARPVGWMLQRYRGKQNRLSILDQLLVLSNSASKSSGLAEKEANKVVLAIQIKHQPLEVAVHRISQ